MIHRIMYMSRAAVLLSDLDVELLANRASAKNEVRSITGLLLFDGRRFLQAIEGSKDAVTKLMDEIAKDDRHDMVEIMANGRAKRRKFGEWGMAYKRVGEDCCTTGYLHNVKERMASVPNIELQAAFIGFAKLAYQAEG